MRDDFYVYLSGPIAAKYGRTVEQNVADATAVYFRLLQHGIPAHCPHLSALCPSAFTAIDYDTWIRYDCAIINRCTHLLLLPRWELSAGALKEVEHATQRRIPIIPDEEALYHLLSEHAAARL